MAKFCTRCGNLLENCTCQQNVTVKEPWEQAQNTTVVNNEKKGEKINISLPTQLDKEKAVSKLKKLSEKVGIGGDAIGSGDVFEKNKKIVPECVVANDGEVPIRQYTVAKLRTLFKLNFATGRLQITNKRVIFRAPGWSLMGKTMLQHEFAIDEIAGIEIKKEPKFGFMELLFAFIVSVLAGNIVEIIESAIIDAIPFLGQVLSLAIMIVGVIPPFVLKEKFIIKSLSVSASIGAGLAFFNSTIGQNAFSFTVLIILAFLWQFCSLAFALKKNLVLIIKTKGASPAVEIRRKKRKSLFELLFGNNSSEKEEYTGFSRVYPAGDTDRAVNEIGAMINDIQKLGDYGIEKWQEK